MTSNQLANNLAVVFRHLEEVGNLYGTLISVLTLTDGHDSIGNFLLSHDEEVRYLLEFALANLVAEFLTPSASVATPRSCTLSFTRAQKSATSYVGLMGVPAHSVRSGYIARPPVRTCGTPARLLQPSLAPRVLSPRGTIPNAKHLHA